MTISEISNSQNISKQWYINKVFAYLQLNKSSSTFNCLTLTLHDSNIRNGHRFFVLENAVKAVATFFIDKLYVFERDVEKRTLDPCQSGLRQKEKCESLWKMHLQSIFKTSCKSCRFTNGGLLQ